MNPDLLIYINVECHIKVSDLPAHPGRLLCLDVSDGGEGGAAGGVQGEAGHNLSDLLLLLDAGSGRLHCTARSDLQNQKNFAQSNFIVKF